MEYRTLIREHVRCVEALNSLEWTAVRSGAGLSKGIINMAQIIHYCFKCREQGLPDEVRREDAPHLTESMESSGYCDPHGEEYLAECRRYNEQRKQQQKGQSK